MGTSRPREAAVPQKSSLGATGDLYRVAEREVFPGGQGTSSLGILIKGRVSPSQEEKNLSFSRS